MIKLKIIGSILVTALLIVTNTGGTVTDLAPVPPPVKVVAVAQNLSRGEVVSKPDYWELEVKSTAYCSCAVCTGNDDLGHTATGTIPVSGRTIAVDKNVIPLGSRVQIGDTVYIAEDTGSAIKGNRIDIYYNYHSNALKYGVRMVKIKVYYK